MKERPILFNGPMVRGVLSGQKTTMRRVIKNQPDVPVTDAIPRRNYPHGPATVDWYWRPKHGHYQSMPSAGWDFKCPYGQSGDRLWVREAFGLQVRHYGGGTGEHIVYRATKPDAIYCKSAEGQEYPVKWKPNTHMPRRSSRILLEITDVRVERLRDSADLALLDELGDMLDDCDSVAGKEFSRIEKLQSAGAPLSMLPEMYGFKAYWEKVNGAGSFDDNPWVWVVEFKRTSPNELSYIR